MAYIGNAPAEAYTNTVKDSFNGTGSATVFTLSQPTLTNDVRVVVENVVQDPAVAYNVSGTALTFTSAPPSGTDNIYVVHLGPAVMTTVPPAEIADATTFASSVSVQGAFTSLGIDDNATSTAITIDASENVGIGTSPSAVLHVNTGSTVDNTSAVLIESTSSAISTAPDLALYKNSATPADNDYVGALWFYGNNSAGAEMAYAGITTLSTDVTDGTEDGALAFVTARAGSTGVEAMRINSLGGVIAGATDPSYGGAVAGDVVTTGGLNLNGMHVIKSKYMNLTTTAQDILLCGLRATYKITISSCDTSTGSLYGSETAWVSVSNNTAIQGGTVQQVNGQLVLAWKAGNGTSGNSRTLTARTTSSAANAWVITVEIQSNYARSTEGSAVGMSQFLI